MAKGNTWTLQELNYLSNNYEFGKSKEIAKKLGRSTNAIREKARRLGLTENRKTVFNGVFQESVHNKLEVEGKINMKRYRLDVNVGDEVLVLTNDYNRKQGKRRRMEGKIIAKNNKYITVQGEKYKESFTLGEFYCGEAELIKEGQAWN